MAVFIVKAQYAKKDDERDFETVYVGENGKEAFEVTLDGYYALHLEVWINNEVFEKQVNKDISGWVETFNALKKLEESISIAKVEVKKQNVN